MTPGRATAPHRREVASAIVDLPVAMPGGSRCIACEERVKAAVETIAGVTSVQLDPASARLTATFDPAQLKRERLVAEVERAGHEVAAGIGHVSWRVSGMDCPDCARSVDKSVSYVDGVLSANLNYASGILAVEYDSATDPRAQIAALVSKMGYGVEAVDGSSAYPVAELALTGIDCPDCAGKLVARIRAMQGVHEAAMNAGTAPRLRVGYDPAITTPQALARDISKAGYAVEVLGADVGEGRAPGWWQRYRTDAAAAASGVLIAIAWVLGLAGAPEAAATIAYALAILVGGALVFRRAIASVRARSLDMNVLMTVAVIGAAGIGEWAEGAAVVFLFAVGGMLESRSLDRTHRSIRELMDLAPETARVLRDGRAEEVSPSGVLPGEVIVVRPGERVPLDAEVIEGSSAVDESPITGESVPVDKAPGDALFAGTLNTGGLLEARVRARAGDSTLSRVVRMVEQAQSQQAPFQRLVDRFTRYYTPAVVVFAASVATVPPLAAWVLAARGFDVTWGDPAEWFYRALVLLVVSCPCALVISTPVAIVSAITRAARDGILVKGGAFLEMAPRVRAVAFDKTGTLTHGRPEVADVLSFGDIGAAEVVELAAAVEAHSNHPLAGAVLRAAGAASALPKATGVNESPGKGMRGRVGAVDVLVTSPSYAEEILTASAQAGAGTAPNAAFTETFDAVERLEDSGQSVLVVLRRVDDRVPVPVGVIGVADRVRDSSRPMVQALGRAGVEHVVMLTGDNERTAAAVAAEAGMGEYRARLLPEDKTSAVRELRERFGSVMMVGDGINDAPALALADIGVAMGAAGSDTALATADVALMSDDLAALPRLLDLGRRTVTNIKQNVGLSVVVKLAVLLAAVAGYAPLWLAVFADTGMALLVILNSLRLLRA